MAYYRGGEIKVWDILAVSPKFPENLNEFRLQLRNVAQDHLFALHARELGMQNEPELRKRIDQIRKQTLRMILYQHKVKERARDLFESTGKDSLSSLPGNLFKIQEIVRKEFEDSLRIMYKLKFNTDNFESALQLAKVKKEQLLARRKNSKQGKE